ncbi:hypothetical protein BGZ65_004102, partial [Modicella reniformis]
YLMELLRLSNHYEAPRLKELIAYEIISKMMVTHGNAFSVRSYAEQGECGDIQEYCNKYLKTNLASMRTFLDGEQMACISSMVHANSDDQKAAIMKEIEELMNNRNELDALA